MPTTDSTALNAVSRKGKTVRKRSKKITPEHHFKGHKIKVYSTGHRFSAQFYDSSRHRHRFEKASEWSAIEAAKQKIREITDADTQEEALEESRTNDILRPYGVTSIEVARLYVSISDRLKPHNASIENAIDYFLSSRAIKPVIVHQVVSELIAVKTRDRGAQYVRDLRIRLERQFCSEFGQRNLGDLSKAELNIWLDSLQMSARSRRNTRSALVTLFRFAQSRGYLPDDRPTAIERTERPKAEKPKREIYKPEEMIALLAATHVVKRPVLAPLVIAGFSGVRTEELCQTDPKKDRLRWEDISWSESGPEIHIRPEVSKTGEERFIPMSTNLQLWLKPICKKQGTVYGADSRLDLGYAALSRGSGIKWKRNALRRSYATYRSAASASVNATVSELGNSASMLKRHYRRPIPAATAQAEQWFSITPELVAKAVDA